MLDQSSPRWLHVLQDVVLLILSLLFLPLDTAILALSEISWRFTGRVVQHRAAPSSPRTVLVTGVGMTKGLVLARLFAACGHRVIGADFSSIACGRFSKALSSFYTLKKPAANGDASDYVNSLLAVISRERVELWVSCSGVASAIEDGLAKEAIEASTTCKAVQYDVPTTKLLHEKSSFIPHVAKLGLPVPETHTVTSRGQIHEVLSQPQKLGGRKYICKCVGVDDVSRGIMTLLPLASEEETKLHVREINVTERNPWIVQQYVHGREYCTHALVIQGQVKAFVACPSSELLMHYVALPPDSALSLAMQRFTEIVARDGGARFTGHLSFDFLVDETDLSEGVGDITLYPIECNPRTHTAVALFNKTPDLVRAYESLLERASDLSGDESIVYPNDPNKFYWVGHDFVCSFLLPCTALVTRNAAFGSLLDEVSNLIQYVLYWKDGTFEWSDPAPWWSLYHVYWPTQFLGAIVKNQNWSRINVSTTRMFVC